MGMRRLFEWGVEMVRRHVRPWNGHGVRVLTSFSFVVAHHTRHTCLLSINIRSLFCVAVEYERLVIQVHNRSMRHPEVHVLHCRRYQVLYIR